MKLLTLGGIVIGGLVLGCGSSTDVVDHPGAGGAASATSTGAGGATATASSTTGTGGSGATGPECATDADCELVNDCCSCLGIASGEAAPACDMEECFATTCDAMGFPTLSARCAAGQCVAGFPCDQNTTLCASLPPSCEPGHTPSILGACWGPCVLASECGNVTACSDCDAAAQLCVVDETQLGPAYHCVALPPACQGSPDCACMGEAVCVEPYDTCVDAEAAVTCTCPAC